MCGGGGYKPWKGAHIHQSMAWPVPLTCEQPHYPGSGSHGQLFRPYWGSSAWHSRRVNPCLKDPFLPRRVQSTLLSANSTQYMWELLDGTREVLPRPWVGVCLPFALSLSYVYDVFIILHCNSFLSYFFFCL